MSKRTKRQTKQTRKRRPLPASRGTVGALDKALELVEEEDYAQAKTRLVELAGRYPRSAPVLTALVNVCHALEDWHSAARYNEQLLTLEQGADRADTLNNLLVVYINLNLPGLAWKVAQELVERHPEVDNIDDLKGFLQVTGDFLKEQAALLLPSPELSLSEKLATLAQHDWVRFYTETNQPAKAIAAAEAALEKLPGIVPILNNVSLSYFMAGELGKAIEAAKQALAQEPDNFHALSNAARFYFLTAQFDTAREYAARLAQVASDNPDLAAKQAEVLAYLGDDEGVRRAYVRAKVRKGHLSPLLLHLAAAAHYRLGDEKTAWALWGQAVKEAPSLSLAQDNLADRDRPVGERNAPWYWPINYWFAGDLRQTLADSPGGARRPKGGKAAVKAIREWLETQPQAAALLPHILERGDGRAREFVVEIARLAETEAMARIVYDFGRGPYGTDELRLKAIRFVSSKFPTMLPEDGKVTMWLHGQETETLQLSFEIYNEPEPPEAMDDDILDMHTEGYDLLLNGQAAAAERLFREVIAAAPDFPSAYNQLAVAYEMQGQQDKALELLEQTHARFPDYFFARAGLTRFYARGKRIEEARELVAPLMHQRRFHSSEFAALAQAQMEIALAAGLKQVAQSWLDMWTQLEPGNRNLMYWRSRIVGVEGLLNSFEKLAQIFGRKGQGRKGEPGR